MAHPDSSHGQNKPNANASARIAPKTYGKQPKPLPLQGIHFIRSDAEELPQDDEEEAIYQDLEAHARQRRREPDPEDSPLSEGELEYVYGRDASPVLSPSSSPRLPTSGSKTSTEPREKSLFVTPTRVPSDKERLAEPVSKLATKPRYQQAQQGASSANRRYPNNARSRPSFSKKTETKQRHRQLKRRLPVNELPLTDSPPAHRDIFRDTQSSFAGVETQDPIADPSSSGRKGRIPSIEDELEKPRALLTPHRKRLKIPLQNHKSKFDLLKKKGSRAKLARAFGVQSKLGDGFDVSERKVDHRRFTPRRRQNVPKSLMWGFGELEIKSGPLPDVKFEQSCSELQLVSAHEQERPNSMGTDQAGIRNPDDEYGYRCATTAASTSCQKAKRKVSFSDRILDDKTWARLSSVSAPKRAYSISSDDGESSEVEPDDDESEISANPDEDEGLIYEDHDSDNESHVESDDEGVMEELQARTPPSNQRARQSRIYWQPTSSSTGLHPPVNNKGMTLNFRKSDIQGMAMPRTPFNKRRMMEVNEMIMDEEDPDEMLDSEPAPPLPLSRPRSILRNPKPRYSHSSEANTRPEDTFANTRRNSMVNLEDSRYSTTAADRLQAADGTTKPIIIKQRTSDRHYARSQYFPKEVQVPDSDSAVPETSQARLHYGDEPQLDILKRSSEATWTSSESSLRIPRDLKTLTRTVSREHGTLSQAVRRRPSIPFRSPTKAR
ncbi:Hypothetical predicted protein [Lecanosticta acicola]|uniref:Uncharacterized protein n=1 Tax=Lecanosticta acicola TaxID=111012 RepID=A0AAI8YU54_9PEZI|nr:Hypothetical predicted protein [Lecanosticta acicola]